MDLGGAVHAGLSAAQEAVFVSDARWGTVGSQKEAELVECKPPPLLPAVWRAERRAGENDVPTPAQKGRWFPQGHCTWRTDAVLRGKQCFCEPHASKTCTAEYKTETKRRKFPAKNSRKV